MRRSAEERFWSFVRAIPDDARCCWYWAGATCSRGYGTLYVDGKTVLAHRFSFELHNGFIVPHLQVLHSCDNRLCVNPYHFSQGTNSENVRDRERKGRNKLYIANAALAAKRRAA